MNWKKSAESKRTALPRACDFTRQFLKDWERLSASGRYDMNRLKEVMSLIFTNSGPLPVEWCDHPLSGDWAQHRQCHVGGDFLLVYRFDAASKTQSVLLVRAGTHADLFE